MASGGGEEAEKCPVDHQTRERWLEVARRTTTTPQNQHQHDPSAPTPTTHQSGTIPSGNSNRIIPPPPSHTHLFSTLPRWSLDHSRWVVNPDSANASPPPPRPAPSALSSISPASQPKRPRLSQDREVSSIPRSLSTTTSPSDLNPAERAALPSPNNEADTGHDAASGNWIYPSQEMFFNAMRRKGHKASPNDMSSIVPIHNAVNERAWSEILTWERGWGAERCGGPKLVSFAGDSKALTPRARWNSLLGYKAPFDRHDWVVERCGKKVEYVIDFYKGRDGGVSPLSFYLDVRPKLNSWEGVKMRAARVFGM